MPSLDIAFTTLDPVWDSVLDSHEDFFVQGLQKTFAALALPSRSFSLSCVLANDTIIRELNRDYRHKDSATNVLSFPMFDDFDDLPEIEDSLELGDIILAHETIAKEAEEQEKPFRDHVMHLLVHGFLHLCGFDHMTEDERHDMEALEKEILAALGIADPYND